MVALLESMATRREYLEPTPTNDSDSESNSWSEELPY